MLKDLVVHHATYGPGTIVAATDDTASVHFRGAGRGATRRFLIAALFDDDLFPRARNAALWKLRGFDAHKRSTLLKRQNESDAMKQALDLADPRKKPGGQ
jgi:hypothetical protein